MEVGAREWFIVIGILLTLGIVLDGIRRSRNSGYGSIKMSRSMPKSDDNPLPDENFSSELPSGGGRVVSYRDEEKASVLNNQHREQYEPSSSKKPPASELNEQTALNLDETVPMLMEVEGEDPNDPLFAPTDERTEPHFNSDLGPQTHSQAQQIAPKASDQQPASSANTPNDIPDEVLVFNIMSRQGEHFAGQALLDALLQNHLRFGEMNIFHRHSDSNGEGPVLFSCANMVVPGTFDLDAIESFSTPGISLFMTLPINYDSIAAYELLVQSAKNISERLGGDLKDENRSVMTAQTIEHGRQRVQEFTRKQQLAKA